MPISVPGDADQRFRDDGDHAPWRAVFDVDRQGFLTPAIFLRHSTKLPTETPVTGLFSLGFLEFSASRMNTLWKGRSFELSQIASPPIATVFLW